MKRNGVETFIYFINFFGRGKHMHVRLVLVLLVCGILAVTWASGARIADASPGEKPNKPDDQPERKSPSFKTDVMPILKDACANCHAGRKKKGRVDLSTYDTVMKSVKANDPDKSRLVRSVTGNGAKLMPPKTGLSNAQVKIIREWISAGAKND